MCGQKWGGKITGEAVSAWSHREYSGNTSGLWRHVEVRILAKSESTEAFNVIGGSLLLKAQVTYSEMVLEHMAGFRGHTACKV